MAKRYQARRRATDDTSALAGWLFTDLLLGLVMIFLSAVAFTAFKSEDSLQTAQYEVCTEYFAAYDEKPLVLDFTEKSQAMSMSTEIENHVKNAYKVGSKAKVAVGIIYGYYSGSIEYEGNNRAKDYYAEFVKSEEAKPDDEKNFRPFDSNREVINMRFFGSKGRFAPVDGVRAELFFSYNACGNYIKVSSTTLP